ncbi:hypothetical protein LCGC14_0359330 [marine sediment metagenome]|uniref:Rad50/SbcC-type AAA domain-containing protein n=1 Tax=marine sediment metagenome TaxID=412755 RepID=A0A0F9WGM5_9ZZZZ|nr:hypothetical protein [Candidatus Aminicenantes bacterium]
MKILQLVAENVKKIKAIDITPKGDTVVISGDNEEGKSSVLDSIWYALGGGKAMKGVKQPIRKGQKNAYSTVDLGEIVVTRSWTQKGSTLKVISADGSELKSPQSVLDKLIGDLSFDPLAFTQMDEKKQRETLLGLIDLDLDLEKWEEKRKKIYDERTEVNSNLKTAESNLAENPEFPDDTPDETIEFQNIMDELEEAQEYNKEIEDAIQKTKEKEELYDQLKKQAMIIKRDIEELKRFVKGQELADIDSIKEMMSEIQTINTNVVSKDAKKNFISSIEDLQLETQQLSENIAELDKRKVDALKSAEFPIDNLAFDEDGVTYKDIPFKQCSAAESLRVSLAMAMALNPKLRVLRIMDGSLIGPKNKKIIKEMVKDKDYQVWIECVNVTGEMGVYIEDGEVVKDNYEKKGEKHDIER